MYVSEIRSALRKALRWFTVFWSRSKNVILLIVIGLLLNVIPAQLRLEFGVPLYLDCLGTVLTAMLGGYLPSVIVGFGVNAYNGITQEPVAMYYGVLSIFIATTATYMYRRGFFKRIWKFLIVILVLALIGGGLGSIFTYALYGFNFGEGISAPFAIAFHDVMHWDRFTSQFVADIVIDVFDKSAIVLLSALIFRFIPKAYKEKLKDCHEKIAQYQNYEQQLLENIDALSASENLTINQILLQEMPIIDYLAECEILLSQPIKERILNICRFIRPYLQKDYIINIPSNTEIFLS